MNIGTKVDITKQAKVVNITVSAIMCAVGVLLLLPLFDAYTEKMLIGALCIAVSMAKICGYFSNDLYRLAFQYDLAVGCFALIFGILFLVSPQSFNDSIPNSIGGYVILESLLKLQIATDARRFGMRHWGLLLGSAILLCGVGVLTVISTYSREIDEHLMLALALCAVGLENAWVTAYTVRVRAKKKCLFEELEDEDDPSRKEERT